MLELFKRIGMRVEIPFLDFEYIIKHNVQRPFCNLFRFQTTHDSGGGVACVGVWLFAHFDPLLVHGLKSIFADKYLAPHDKPPGWLVAKSQRYGSDGAKIGRNILACRPVT